MSVSVRSVFHRMAILDIFSARGGKKTIDKRGKSRKKPSEKDKKEDSVVKVEVAEVTEEKRSEPVTGELKEKRPSKKDFSYAAYRFLKSPHVTEKAVGLEAQNKYVFRINSGANKTEVKKAIEELYGVAVEEVNVVKIPRKKRRVGRSEGFKAGYKKAIVTLREGDKIETGV